MSFVQAQFFSPVLSKQAALYAILPDKGTGPFPVFYLLHGLSDDHTIWHRRTRIECYAQEYPMIVVMPDGYRGFYTDCEEGPAYGRYLVEDVLGYVERTFHALPKRQGRCIGGLSMGGYGAVRVGLAHAEKFQSITSHSGAFPSNDEREFLEQPEFRRIFGPHPEGSAHDTFALASKLKQSGKRLPRLRIDCGTEDFLLQQNRKFHAHLEGLGFAHEYEEFPGAHTWDYWDLHVREALAFHARALGVKKVG